jgi:hypothetical protein
VIPLYFPRFWAELEYSPDEGKVLFHVIRKLDERPIVLKQIVIEPMGTASKEAVTVPILPFTVETGRNLDLSSYMEAFEKLKMQAPILEPNTSHASRGSADR